MSVLDFLRAKWRWLAFPLLAILGVLLLSQATEYGRALLAKHGLVKQQAQASTQHAQQQAATTARYTGFQLDSVKRSTEAAEMLRQVHLSQQRDAQLSKNRPARPVLPAWNDLPRE
ncbi:MAG: hypothetical protein ACRYFZ_09780 [Janthinobacterium lividum]